MQCGAQWEHSPYFDLVAIVASAGGLKAISQVLANLPPDFSAAVIVVIHLSPRHRSWLPEILGRRTRLRVLQAVEGVTRSQVRMRRVP